MSNKQTQVDMNKILYFSNIRSFLKTGPIADRPMLVLQGLLQPLRIKAFLYINLIIHNCLAVCDAAIFKGSHTGEAGGT
jgi:hypothetical protein